MTLNAVIQRIKAVATSHGQVNYFFFGTVDDYLQMNDVPKHVSVILTLKSAKFIGDRQSQTQIDFALYVMDWSGIEVTGQQDLWSDTLLIAHDILASLKDETANDFYLVEGLTLTPFNEKFSDSLTGWMMDLTIGYDSELDRCAIPN
jgi:hypothetical protein